jgi:hypothetical protein
VKFGITLLPTSFRDTCCRPNALHRRIWLVNPYNSFRGNLAVIL